MLNHQPNREKCNHRPNAKPPAASLLRDKRDVEALERIRRSQRLPEERTIPARVVVQSTLASGQGRALVEAVREGLGVELAVESAGVADVVIAVESIRFVSAQAAALICRRRGRCRRRGSGGGRRRGRGAGGGGGLRGSKAEEREESMELHDGRRKEATDEGRGNGAEGSVKHGRVG